MNHQSGQQEKLIGVQKHRAGFLGRVMGLGSQMSVTRATAAEAAHDRDKCAIHQQCGPKAKAQIPDLFTADILHGDLHAHHLT